MTAMRYPFRHALGAFCTVAALGCATTAPDEHAAAPEPPVRAAAGAAEPTLRMEAGDYVFALYPDPQLRNLHTLTVWQGDEAVYEIDEPMAITLISPYADLTPEGEALFEGDPMYDMDGDGYDDVVVALYTGGAHCCYRYIVLSVHGPLRELGIVDAQNSEALVSDIDDDGLPDWSLNDWTFQYWKASFADSPAPRVVLNYQGDGFYPAPALMAAEPPDADAWEASLAEVRYAFGHVRAGEATHQAGDPWAPVPPVLWGGLLDLYYTGHGDLAPAFLDAAWPPDKPGKDAFWAAFRGQLMASPYWEGIDAMTPAGS